MTRKDLIIVAVLINCGLLIALFIGAVRKDHLPLEKTQVEKIAQVSSPDASKGEDQIEQILTKYSEKLAEKEQSQSPQTAPSILTPAVRRVEGAVVANKEEVRQIVIEKGDVLEKIARSHSVRVDEIMRLNAMESTHLHIGQVLKLPSQKPLEKGRAKSEHLEEYYTVKSGDNPWTIAQENKIQVETLLRLNHMDEAKAKRLRPGDRLKIKE